MNKLRRWLALVALVALSNAAAAAPLVVLPGPGAQQLADAAAQTRPWQFAVGIPAALDSTVHGVWREEGEHRIWQLSIQSPGATSLSLHFDHWEVSPGTELWLHDVNSDQKQGPYGARYNATGALWTGMLLSDTVRVELRAPRNAALPQVRVAKAMHGFRSTQAAHGVPLKSGNCNIDVACPEANPYADQVRSAVLLIIGGSAACSGTLINSTRNDFAPLVLTADHCQIGSGNDESVVTYFNFQRSSCERGAQSSREEVQLNPQQSISGSEFVSGNPASDFTLLALGSLDDPAAIPTAWKPYWSGWTRSEVASDAGASIHHPSADEKSIAVYNTPLQRQQLQDNGQTVATWQVVWSAGTTEQGSSGSAIYGTDGLIRGQLYGGGASCGTPTNPDFYGRFAVSWDGADAAAKQLAVWLDPEGQNPGAWGGLDFDGTLQAVDTAPPPTPVPTTGATTPSPSPGGNSGSGSVGEVALLGLLALLGGGLGRRRRPQV